MLGTLGYMSPEQVKGKPADARSDIFSFGAILYEMLSGQRAFHGDSAAETMSAILKEDPPDLSVTNQSVSPGLERIVRHCLEKNPEQRFQSAHDLAFDLEALSGLSVPRLEPRRCRFGGRSPPLAVLAAACSSRSRSGSSPAGWSGRASPRASRRSRRLTFRPGPGHVRPLRSGRADDRLRGLLGRRPEARALLRAGGEPRIAPAGAACGTGRVDLAERRDAPARYSCSPRRATRGPARSRRRPCPAARRATCSKTSARGLVARRQRSRGRARAAVAIPAGVSGRQGPLRDDRLDQPSAGLAERRRSRRSSTIRVFGDDRGSVAVVDRSGKKKTLSHGMGRACRASPGLLPAKRSGSRRHGPPPRVRSTPCPLSGRQRTVATTPAGMTLQDISRDGRAALHPRATHGSDSSACFPERRRSGTSRVWSGRTSRSSPRTERRLVFTRAGRGRGTRAILSTCASWTARRPVRLGEGNALAHLPGRKVGADLPHAFDPLADRAPADRGRRAESFPKDEIDHAGSEFGAFLPDGKRIVFAGHEPGRPPRVFVQDLAGGAARPVTPEGVVASLLSPDGKSLVTQTPEGLALTPLEGGPSRPIPGLEPDDRPLRFAVDGRSLFLRVTAGDSPRGLPSRPRHGAPGGLEGVHAGRPGGHHVAVARRPSPRTGRPSSSSTGASSPTSTWRKD